MKIRCVVNALPLEFQQVVKYTYENFTRDITKEICGRIYICKRNDISEIKNFCVLLGRTCPEERRVS